MFKNFILLSFIILICQKTKAQVEMIHFGKEYYYTEATSIAQDKDGYTYVAGYISSEFTLKWKSYSQKFYPNNNSKDIYLIKLNTDFTIAWCKLYGGPGDERDPKITIDAEGNVYLGGSYSKTWNVSTTNGTVILESNKDRLLGFLAKVNKDGNIIWAKAIDNSLCASLGSIQITHNNNLLVSGYFGNKSILKNNIPTELPEGDNRKNYLSFIKTFNINGDNLLTKYFEAKNWSFVKGATSDVKNNYYTFGYFTDTNLAIINNPKYPILSNIHESRGAFIEKLNEKGTRIWRKEIGKLRGVERRSITLQGVAIDEDENVYYCGVFRDSVYSGIPKHPSLLAVKLDDILMGKLNKSGHPVWMKSLGSNGDDEAKTIVYNSAENKIMIGGFYSDAIPAGKFGNNPEYFKPKGGKNIFLSELDTDGNYILNVAPESPSYNRYNDAIKHPKMGFVFAINGDHYNSAIVRYKADNWDKYITIVPKKADIDLISDYEKGYNAFQQKKYTESVTWFKKAAETGNAEAMFNLALVYQMGGEKEFPPNEKEALIWFEKAAAKDHVKSMIRTAEIYLSGKPPHDYAKAMTWFKKAAEKGDESAMYNVGLLYASGTGVPINMEEAKKWYTKAANKGFKQAKDVLTKIESEGQASSELNKAKAAFDNKEYATALEWYKKGADKGYSEAYYMLGHMHLWGMGTSKNEVEARKWYNKAAEKGHQKAKDALSGMDEDFGF